MGDFLPQNLFLAYWDHQRFSCFIQLNISLNMTSTVQKYVKLF